MQYFNRKEIEMKPLILSAAVFAAAISLCCLSACTEQATGNNGNDNPATATMNFKSGARYQFQSYHTDAASGQKTDSSARVRTWTLVRTNATAWGQAGVAVYVDSVFSVAGGILSVADTTYFRQ